MLGPCNSKCAAQHWKALGGSGSGPICGVPGCAAAPSPSPPPPPPPSPPKPPAHNGSGHGPFRPIEATNCTWIQNTGSHDGAIAHVASAQQKEECCAACFANTECVLATLVPEGKGCFLHATAQSTRRANGVLACVTGRAAAGPDHGAGL